MKTSHRNAQLGALIVDLFDEAQRFTNDPREVSLLATRAVRHLVQRGRTSTFRQGRHRNRVGVRS
jgi:hypothetical protein